MSSSSDSRASAGGGLYLIRFLQVHESFRKPELEALARIAGVKCEIVDYRDNSPFCIIKLESDVAATALISRSVLCTGIWTLWGHAPTYKDLKTYMLTSEATLALLAKHEHSSFRFDVDCFQGKRSDSARRDLMESLGYLPLRGTIAMRNPDLRFTIFEEYSLLPTPPPIQSLSISDSNSTTSPAPRPKKLPDRVFLGSFLAASDRDAVSLYDLKRRAYISTTSMDANLALVTANLALAAPGKVAYDPFMGTGGFPLACAHFGAHVMGSDIDGRSVRGKGKKPGGKGAAGEKSVVGNFRQYGTLDRYLDGFIGDLTNTPLRVPGFGRDTERRWLDAVVCDPPYGVREGLKTLGSVKPGQGLEPVLLADGQLAHLAPDYIPPKRPYSFDALQLDILNFAVRTLVDGGRLCMWLPTANDPECECESAAAVEDSAAEPEKCPSEQTQQSDTSPAPAPGSQGRFLSARIPAHPGLELISVCAQDFNKWSRKLLTYQRRQGIYLDVRLGEAGFALLDGEIDGPTALMSRSAASLDPGNQPDTGPLAEGGEIVGVAQDGRDAELGSRIAPAGNAQSAGLGPGLARGRADELNAFRKKYFQGFR